MNGKLTKEKLPYKKKIKETRCFGPILDLEEYVHQDWWKRIFNSLYLKTDADVIDDQQITSQEGEIFLNILGFKPEDKILDLCCGQGRHSLELARKGFKNVEGLDRSHYLIHRARSLAKKELLNVKFKEGDARKLPYLPDTFDVVMILGNSFGYFETMHDDLRVLKEIFRVLKPWGKLLINVADGEYLVENFQPRSWEWIDEKYFVCRERSFSKDKQRLISREVITHAEKGVIADQFYAERLYSKESLMQLLKETGFTDVTFHGEFSPNSKRNQDLGMMERCLVVTAIIRKEWSAIKKVPKEVIKNIAVILGDPNKPDPLKPYSVFDDNDFYTIDQLKSALKLLKNYHFVYLNNHDTLPSDLMKMKGKVDFIFNLCDEGYNNDPRRELHLPAMLEIIGIPYTGSGPQSLAYCYDKSLVRGIAKEMEITVPKAFFIKQEDTIFSLPFGFPIIVKPNFGDSSFGITQKSVAYNIEGLVNAISEIREKFGYDKPILVEELLMGKDLTVGIIGNPPDSYNILPIMEEDYSALPSELPKICGYEAKWLSNSPYWNIKSIPAVLPKNTKRVIIECCLKLYERLECRDYCRFDWRLDTDGVPKLLEVNPNPGWCWDGHLAKMAKATEMSYSEMIEAILTTTEQRLEIPIILDKKREEESIGKKVLVTV